MNTLEACMRGADVRQPISLESQLLSEGPGGLGGEKGRSLLDMVGQGQGVEHRMTSSLRSSSRSTAASTKISPSASVDLVIAYTGWQSSSVHPLKGHLVVRSGTLPCSISSSTVLALCSIWMYL